MLVLQLGFKSLLIYSVLPILTQPPFCLSKTTHLGSDLLNVSMSGRLRAEMNKLTCMLSLSAADTIVFGFILNFIPILNAYLT